MLSVKEEKERLKRLEKQPYKEGHYKLDGNIVRVSATLYPKIKWWIENISVPAFIAVPGSREELTWNIYQKLESFL